MKHRKVYIVIHGTGGTLRQTVSMLSEINTLSAKWWDGVFHTDKKSGLVLRKILSDADDSSPLFNASRKIIASRLLRNCANPEKPGNPRDYASFDEAMLVERFPEFDIPFGPAARGKAAARLEREGQGEFMGMFRSAAAYGGGGFSAFMSDLLANLHDEDGTALSESEAFVKIAALAGGEEAARDLVQLRDMGESGADLDTISSATFYAYALANHAAENEQPFRYGADYEFVFVNYHQGLQPLMKQFPEPGDIYMADVPIGTIPDLPSDLAALSEKGYSLARYEDHHPYTAEQMEMLESLHKKGLIGFFAMSGPLQGEELPDEVLKCGGDMVYESLIMGRKWDNPAMAYLRKCVHGEDLAQERTDDGRLLTELIKGGTNSIEIVQTLLSCRKEVDIGLRLSEKGWAAKIAKEREEISKLEPKFREAVQVLRIERPAEEKGMSGQAMGWGSDMPVPKERSPKNEISILIAMAPSTSRKEPKLKIGRAQEYFSREMPEADYLLYCYGSSLIVGRRLNQADFSLNLSVLMRKIGTESDGGHAGAAVCGPDKNPNYPKSILGRVDKGNFKLYCRYLEKHISKDLNVRIISRMNISEGKPTKAQEGGLRQLLVLMAATLLLGGAVLLFNSDYRPSKLAELNKKDFFAWFGKEHQRSSEDGAAPAPDDGDNERMDAQ